MYTTVTFHLPHIPTDPLQQWDTNHEYHFRHTPPPPHIHMHTWNAMNSRVSIHCRLTQSHNCQKCTHVQRLVAPFREVALKSVGRNSPSLPGVPCTCRASCVRWCAPHCGDMFACTPDEWGGAHTTQTCQLHRDVHSETRRTHREWEGQRVTGVACTTHLHMLTSIP